MARSAASLKLYLAENLRVLGRTKSIDKGPKVKLKLPYRLLSELYNVFVFLMTIHGTVSSTVMLYVNVPYRVCIYSKISRGQFKIPPDN